LCQQAAEGVPNHRRFLVQLADHVGEMVGHLPDRLVGEYLGIGVGLVDGLGIARAGTRRYRRTTALAPQRRAP
jgi:hypothetical protein